MQVYKFGGASIATPDRMRALLPIIQKATQPLVVIVSALGKTTNELESIVYTAIDNKKDVALNLLKKLETKHFEYIHDLFDTESAANLIQKLQPYFTEIVWALDDAGVQSDDYLYDQIVCVGELLSTLIFAEFLQHNQLNTVWTDARDVIRTNEHYRNAIVDEVNSEILVKKNILPIVQNGNICVTQGFIGSSSDNNSTTLGREGSDYTAALIAAMTHADKVTIWKDVPGFLNADPRKFNDTVRIAEISYNEVIELAYFGAQIIHPKTIKPIQNKSIPLYVKCFLDDTLEGTVIKAKDQFIDYPPLIVHKGDQSLLKITSKDFSFITEENLSNIYNIFSKYRVKLNMIQNTAISFVATIDSFHFALHDLIQELSSQYEISLYNNCTILTIRHYDNEVVSRLTADKTILLRQQTNKTYQVLYQNKIEI